MSAHPILTHAAALAVAAGAGWFAHGAAPDAPTRPVPPPERPTVAQPADRIAGQPLIAVASDGSVTLRVEQQPLDWVLEQIALQSGYGDLRERMRSAGSVASAASGAAAPSSTPERLCAESPQVAAADARRVLAVIERGNEAERFGGLLAAVSDSVPVPDTLLKSLFETDASDRVRLLALERYLDPRGGDPAALRAALEATLRVRSTAVQLEARRRLDELAANVQPDPP